MQLAEGTVVDQRYTLLRPLGQGGLAVVWLARHHRLGSLHAVKVLLDPSRSVRERLLQEGRVQSVLRHPNLVAVTDTVEIDGTPALVLEYVNGPSLAELLEHHRPTLAEIDRLATGLLAGVAAAHRQGLVHRDLKPANVLLEVTEGRLVPKVTDFGLAKILNPSSAPALQTRSGVAMGTPAYMSPEQIRDSGAADARSDVFALGVLLYELLCGRRPFGGDDSVSQWAAIAAGRYPTTPPT